MTTINEFLGQVDEGEEEGLVTAALEAVRRHFDMQIAYLSEFERGGVVFRAVSAPGFEALLWPGHEMAIDQVLCGHVRDGRLPQLMPDAWEEPVARAVPATGMVPIRSHLSLPVHRSDGSVYGMFCCLGTRPNASLNDRDLHLMQIFADLAARQIQMVQRRRVEREEKRDRIGRIIDERQFHLVFQPIFRLDRAEPTGFEALCRFDAEPRRGPDLWFAEAAELGLGPDLELAVMRAALDRLPDLPAGAYLALNASPETIMSGGIGALLAGRDAARVVIEVTEHAVVTDHERLLAELLRLRVLGVTLAVDDAGAGYSGLQHIVRLQPDIIKLDMSLTRNIDRDRIRRALATALVAFATESGSSLIAEGVETPDELAALREIGVGMAQGFHLCRPMRLEEARHSCRQKGAA